MRLATTGSSTTDAAGKPETSLPVIRIGSGQEPLLDRLRELWRYRELLYFLAWRDVKVRYRQTLLGVAWAVLQPLLTMLLFTIFFGKLAGMPSDGIPYALFAYAGLLPWTFFANAVTNSGESLIANPDLVGKVYLPRVFVPTAAVVACLVDFAVAFGLLIGLLAYYRVAIAPGILLLPPLVVLTTLFALAVGLWAAAVNVKYRDVRYALPFAIQLGLFASPVIYPATLVPESWRALLLLNPLTGIIEGYRAALFGRPLDWIALGASTALTAAALLYATRYFRRMEAHFADLI
ncbi:MAG: ABC transporter permease [Terriglobia bacterium]